MEEVLVDSIRRGVVLLTLNRPTKHNALNSSLIETLTRLIEQAHCAKENRVLLMTGAGSTFCAGMDLTDPTPMGTQLAHLFCKIALSPLVTISAVHGAALAGGLALMACCDVVVAHPKTQFSLPELSRGIVPAHVVTILKYQLRMNELKEMIFLREMVDASKAQAIGLINQLDEEPLTHALKLSEKITSGAPQATRITKRLFNNEITNLKEELQEAIHYHQSSRNSKEAHEGIEAFKKKNTPQWNSN